MATTTFPVRTKPAKGRLSWDLQGGSDLLESNSATESTSAHTRLWSKPRDIEREESFEGEILSVSDSKVSALLTDRQGIEFRAVFSTDEFVPGYAIFRGIKFTARRYVTSKAEVWINQPEPWTPPEPQSVLEKMREAEAVFGDSGY
jgi:hypothetical protein|eukprot:TRINITY_DN54168_c0_g1_i1.p2 TRINITY_DN54168_c0_g1~~TRINITY_DN54168_c0_g1_i1.p2  ORF type:complete len:146 (-),score=3.97 TRINITY_DN54168_c0_g1_i1:134-571(-)